MHCTGVAEAKVLHAAVSPLLSGRLNTDRSCEKAFIQDAVLLALVCLHCSKRQRPTAFPQPWLLLNRQRPFLRASGACKQKKVAGRLARLLVWARLSQENCRTSAAIGACKRRKSLGQAQQLVRASKGNQWGKHSNWCMQAKEISGASTAIGPCKQRGPVGQAQQIGACKQKKSVGQAQQL
eukprot:832887-Pelagomonas_calceolata.AAC.9